MLYQLSYTRPMNFELRISDCEMKFPQVLNPKSAIRNPQFSLVQGAGFEPA
jgi:hypothetical protein